MGKNNQTEIIAALPPVLIGAYSVLNFLETNLNEVRFSDALPLFCAIVLFSILVYVAIRLCGLSESKSSLIASLLLIISIYLHKVSAAIEMLLGTEIKSWLVWCVLMLLLGVFAAIIRKSKRTFESLVKILAVFCGTGVLLVSFNVAFYEKGRLKTATAAKSYKKFAPVHLDRHAIKRDIYYIILDRYGDQKTLSTDFNYDNSEFISFLTSRGFFVAKESYSNYLKTAPSLSSSLSMEYLDFENQEWPADLGDTTPLVELIKKNRVAVQLQDIGYKYIHLGSWWLGTQSNPHADENFGVSFLGQFERVYLQRGIGSYLMHLFDFLLTDTVLDGQCVGEPRKFTRLNEAVADPDPTFVFAHFLIPHDPHIFDKNGRCMDEEERKSRSWEQGYLGQLEYANKQIMDFVARIESQPGPKPIIILQADEGPFPLRYRTEYDDFRWATATNRELKQKMGILNAYYFPEVDTKVLYDHITPVNSFRLLFNSYFDAQMPLLDDKNYAHPSNATYYPFFDVTEKVRSAN